MPTHAIGHGTVNFTINIPIEERDIIGKSAFRKGLSIGTHLKRLILLGMAVDDPASAEALRESRKRAYGILMLVVFTGSLFLGGTTDARRANRQAIRVRRVEQEVREV